MERVTDTHVYFWGLELSNWYPVRFLYKDIEFDNTEQAFMWEKAMLFGDFDTADRILDTPDPKAAKGLGRKVKNFDAERWMVAGYSVMVAVNYAKFSQYPRLKSILLNTGNKTIVEASPYDKIWGVGLYWEDDLILDEKNWKGLNLLGKALMQVRELLRLESSDVKLSIPNSVKNADMILSINKSTGDTENSRIKIIRAKYTDENGKETTYEK